MVDLLATINREAAPRWTETLVQRFGRLDDIFVADTANVTQILGDPRPAHLLRTMREAMLASLREQALERPLIDSLESVRLYLRANMAALPRETLRLLLLDASHRLILDEVMGVGTIDQVTAYPREIVRRALERNGSGAILVHNHPSGLAKPSRTDCNFTRTVSTALQLVGVSLFDHLIVTRSEVSSMREAGLL